MIETFLTAYNPSDLPGGSVDPLGFERGYLLLADKILPGLTNVASRPRYLSLICTGISLTSKASDGTQREVIRKRRDTILRLERFWALACVLAHPEDSSGVRGVTYAKARADQLTRSGAKSTSAKYKLLSRQAPYGVIGVYANVADGMRFLNREDFTLSPALGEVIAQAFLHETEIPSALRRAVVEDGEVSIATLRGWGERAHVNAQIKKSESKCLKEALKRDLVRRRMSELLESIPPKSGTEHEIDRLARVARALQNKSHDQDLRQTIECILAFESCYQLVVLALERFLWLCRHHAAASVTLRELNGDGVLQMVREKLPSTVRHFLGTINTGNELAFRQDLNRLSDVQIFLEETSTATGDIQTFVDTIIGRHNDVQHRKFDRGRRKMPWLERDRSRISLTMTPSGGFRKEATSPEHIAPHPYRLTAADALIVAAQGVQP